MTSDFDRDAVSRRAFLKRMAAAGVIIGGGGLLTGALAAPPPSTGSASPGRLTISPHEVLNSVPLEYSGLSCETVQLADPDYFSPDNHELVTLLRRLNPHGILRLGGNSSEFCWWKTSPDAQPPVQKTVGQGRADNWMPQSFHAITPKAVDNLAGFLKATGWTLIYGLNFGTGSPERDSIEAEYVAHRVGSRLRCFQIGNEPDFYIDPNNLLRPAGWGFAAYLNEWLAIANAVIARVPNAVFGGPDVGSSSDWIVRFAEAAPKRLPGRIVTLSGHYYASGPPDSPKVNIARLLAPNPSVERRMSEIMPVARKAGLDFRMTEGNSCYRGGKAGMSNALASSLWGGDYMLQMASLGCKSINLHAGGGSQIATSIGGKLPGARNAADMEIAKLGTFYSPIAGSREAGFYARPIFYGMMLAQQFAGTDMVRTNFDAGGVNATAYAARADKGYRVALFNKDTDKDMIVDIALVSGSGSLSNATVWRLNGPALDAIDSVTFAGAQVARGGAWTPTRQEHIKGQGGMLTILVPRSSAAQLFIS